MSIIDIIINGAWGIGALLGALFITYRWGKRKGREVYEERSKEVQAKRNEAYDQIDKRNTGPSDAAERLRDGSY